MYFERCVHHLLVVKHHIQGRHSERLAPHQGGAMCVNTPFMVELRRCFFSSSSFHSPRLLKTQLCIFFFKYMCLLQTQV
jgi:hypothetical protein